MSSFATYMNKLQELTQKNLDILNLINDSMYSRQLHNEAIINNTTYSIPSYIYIENKLNELEGNWKRLVNAPLTGTAAFVFDGNTQRIQLKGFENAPESLKIEAEKITDSSDEVKTGFFIENNNIFKDFVTPLIYLKYNLSSIPQDINSVVVRKITIHKESIFNNIKDDSSDITWAKVSSALEAGTENVDYIIYDKVYNLPIKKLDGEGKFTLEKNTIESLAAEDKKIRYRITLDTIEYTYDSERLKKKLSKGDKIVTNDDKAKFEVIRVDADRNIIDIEVLSGYKNISDIEYFKLWQTAKEDQNYIKVPLEEDQYIVIFIAPINSNLNLQAAWGIGQAIDTSELIDSDGKNFKSVYNDKIRNIGDILFDLTKFNTTTLSNIGESGLNELTSYKPVFDTYEVEILNEHLLDNSSVSTLRQLNTQKAEIVKSMQSIQDNINKIKSTLATTDFSSQDITTRTDLESSLSDFNLKRSQKLNNLNDIVNQITLTSGNDNLPTSKTKYVIAGSINTEEIEKQFEETSKAKVIHIELLYRYKNINKEISKTTTISEAVTISNWNKYIIDYRQKTAKIKDNEIVYEFEDNNPDSTTGSWKTYQIPISQGESVDMYFRVQFDLGYPYISTFSDWSDVVNVKFPESLITDTDIKNIITSNNSDSQNIVIKQTLSSEGITSHIDDKLIDQDQTYYHHPENIASGFYTEDSRRVISLKDKLFELNNNINSLVDSAFGSNYKNITVIASYNNANYIIAPNTASTSIILPNKTSLPSPSISGIITLTMLLTITNSSTNYPINIYSMYPGDKNTDISTTGIQSRFINRIDDYKNAWINFYNTAGLQTNQPQKLNQSLYFRTKDLYTGQDSYVYTNNDPTDENNISIIPFIPDLTKIQIEGSVPGDYISLNPNEVISVPVQIKIKSNIDEEISQSISFDIWNSPWRDPLTYTAKIIIPQDNSNIVDVIDSVSYSGYVATLSKPEDVLKTISK